MKLLNAGWPGGRRCFFLAAVPAFAADIPHGTRSSPVQGIAGGLGMGLTIIGAGIGFGKIGGAALDGMARQPEVAGSIQTAMIIIAAMLEGATLARRRAVVRRRQRADVLDGCSGFHRPFASEARPSLASDWSMVG